MSKVFKDLKFYLKHHFDFSLTKDYEKMIEDEIKKWKDFFKTEEEPKIKMIEEVTGREKNGDRIEAFIVRFENFYKDKEIFDEETGKKVSIYDIPMGKLFDYIALYIQKGDSFKTRLTIFELEFEDVKNIKKVNNLIN